MPHINMITLDYGSGGKKTSALIENLIVPAMKSDELSQLGDGAVIKGAEELAFSTDSFVVDPIFFPGGDIGKLSVCGTVNDLSMCGAEPRYLSLSFIIEEGLPKADLETIIASIAKTAETAKVRVVTGDTKVVEKGRGDKIYINTSGIGFIKHKGLSPANIRPGDAVIVSGTVGDHGTAVMLARNKLLEADIRSDCAPLNFLAEKLLSAAPEGEVRVLRDPTRGGVATTLNEFVEGTAWGIELDENAVPIRPEVRSACSMLGLDPLYCANEGKLLCIVSREYERAVLEAMKGEETGKEAAVIGAVTDRIPGKVTVRTKLGGTRIIQKLAGAQLPRIC